MPIASAYLDRRTFLRHASASALVSTLPSWLSASAETAPWKPLGTLGAAKNIAFGCALSYKLLTSNPLYGQVVARECTIATPENAMKWEAVHPARDRYTFEQADAIVAFAEEHSIKMRGHTFCWHRALPPWVTQEVTKDNAEAVLWQHIATVAGRYKGKLHAWDVVNEAIQLKDNMSGGLRNSFWYQMLGPSYLDIAFHATKEADPHAILAYNDYGVEYDNHADPTKRAAILDMLSGMKKRGVPVGALGIQAHLRAGSGEKFGPGLPAFIRDVRALGLEVYVTELDVDDSRLTLEGDARDQAIADVYKQFLDLVLGTAGVPVVITWGVWDMPRVTGAEAVSGPKASRPLLFDPEGKPKPDAFAVAESFRNAPTQRL